MGIVKLLKNIKQLNRNNCIDLFGLHWRGRPQFYIEDIQHFYSHCAGRHPTASYTNTSFLKTVTFVTNYSVQDLIYEISLIKSIYAVGEL